MDVVDAGADFVGVVEVVEGVQQFHVGAGGFDGDDVGVHLGDGFDNVVEVGITHMGVDLGFVCHAVGGYAEGFDGPVQVLLPLGFAQG